MLMLPVSYGYSVSSLRKVEVSFKKCIRIFFFHLILSVEWENDIAFLLWCKHLKFTYIVPSFFLKKNICFSSCMAAKLEPTWMNYRHWKPPYIFNSNYILLLYVLNNEFTVVQRACAPNRLVCFQVSLTWRFLSIPCLKLDFSVLFEESVHPLNRNICTQPALLPLESKQNTICFSRWRNKPKAVKVSCSIGVRKDLCAWN